MPARSRSIPVSVRVLGARQRQDWSMCSAVYLRPYPTIKGENGCIVDNDLITDKKGIYTIVVSTNKARLSNATEEEGVNWLRVKGGVPNRPVP